jgi:predicted branched-subunit amino acid permease
MGVGAAIGEPRRIGIDFAITATFIGIVILSVRRTSDAIVALAAAAIAAAVALAGAPSIAVITAGVVAPVIAAARR